MNKKTTQILVMLFLAIEFVLFSHSKEQILLFSYAVRHFSPDGAGDSPLIGENP